MEQCCYRGLLVGWDVTKKQLTSCWRGVNQHILYAHFCLTPNKLTMFVRVHKVINIIFCPFGNINCHLDVYFSIISETRFWKKTVLQNFFKHQKLRNKTNDLIHSEMSVKIRTKLFDTFLKLLIWSSLTFDSRVSRGAFRVLNNFYDGQLWK